MLWALDTHWQVTACSAGCVSRVRERELLGPQEAPSVAQSVFGRKARHHAGRREVRIQGTFGRIQGTFGRIQGTFCRIQGTFGRIPGTFGRIPGTFGRIQGTFGHI